MEVERVQTSEYPEKLHSKKQPTDLSVTTSTAAETWDVEETPNFLILSSETTFTEL